MNKYKSLVFSLKTFFIYVLVAFCFSCGTKTSQLSKNIDVEITKQSIENCTYFCHYLDFKITNNNDVGIYMPSLRDYFEIINSHGDTIISVVRVYEKFNYSANENTSDYNLYRKEIDAKNNDTLFYLDVFFDFVESEYKLLTNALPKNIEIPDGLEEDARREISSMKYNPIIYLPPKSSLTISKGINYLYYNYIIQEGYIALDQYIYKLSDP